MAKYIDADLLREKITEQMESLPREVGRGAGTITAKGYGMMEAFQIVRSIIDSLQQEQSTDDSIPEDYKPGAMAQKIASILKDNNVDVVVAGVIMGLLFGREYSEIEPVFTENDARKCDYQILTKDGTK